MPEEGSLMRGLLDQPSLAAYWACQSNPADEVMANFFGINPHLFCMKLNRPALIAFLSMLSIFSSRAQATPESDFWLWFERNQGTLFDFERDQERTFDRLAAEMHKVHPSLTFEFGPKNGGRREFVISAGGMVQAFPKVETLFAAAPPLQKWTFIKFRPRRAPFDLRYSGISVKADAVFVQLQPDGQKVGLTVFIPGYTKAAHNTYAGIAFLFLDQALGEFDVESYVSFIEIQEPPPAGAPARSLSQLPTAFDALIKR